MHALESENRELNSSCSAAFLRGQMYRDLYEQAPIGYFTLSSDGSVLMANQTGTSLLGMAADSMPGCGISDWIIPELRIDFEQFLHDVFAGNCPGSIETEIPQKGGPRFVMSIEICKEASDVNCRMMMSDITQRKAAEEADRRLELSTQYNRELEAEVLRRRQAEISLGSAREKLKDSLKQSEFQRKQLRSLSHALLVAQEEERKRISRELHDGIVQALVAIQYQFELLSREPAGSPPRLLEQITRTQDILEDSIDLVHGFAFELRPPALDNLGLGPTLESFAARFRAANEINVTLNLLAKLDDIPSTERTMLYRVAQEAFNNVSRHADARNLRLSIRDRKNGLRMDITDDGVGMNVESIVAAHDRGRLGIVGMKERVDMLGGCFQVLSKPGKYTTIRVDVPISRETTA